MRKKTSLSEQLDLFKYSTHRIGVVRLRNNRRRGDDLTYGLDHVVQELSVNVVRYLDPRNISGVDIALASLMSPEDVLSFVCDAPERPACRMIVGGQGVYPFLAWRHLTHRIMFGRAEGAVDAIVLDDAARPDCYDYDRDPHTRGIYDIRQAQFLLAGEQSVGCLGNCRFCQYRATRPRPMGDYSPGTRGVRVVEDRWQNITPRTGAQTTALDGLSEETRRRIGKPVSDAEIVEKLTQCLREIDGIMRLKVFMIVGFPWETEWTVRADVIALRSLLAAIHPGHRGGRIMLMITVTPFSPEPLTEMEDEPADLETNWRGLLLDDSLRCVFDSPHLNAFFLPQIPGPLTLLRRIAVNRGTPVDRLRALARCKTVEEGLMITGDIHVRGAGARVSGILSARRPYGGAVRTLQRRARTARAERRDEMSTSLTSTWSP